MQRRHFLGTGAVLLAAAGAAGLVRAGPALAPHWNKAAFATRNLNDTLTALGGASATESKDIQFVDPTRDIAENGDVVPIAVTSNLPKTRWIAIMVEKNPTMLSARFDIPEGTEAFISARIKMAETSEVIAMVESGGEFYFAKKAIQVMQCGCGG